MSIRLYRILVCQALLGLFYCQLSWGEAGAWLGQSAQYQPRAELEFKAGNRRGLSRFGFVVPIYQLSDQLFYGSLIGLADTKTASEGNFGMGYRGIVNNWLVGGYAFYDRRQTALRSTLQQITVGLEFLQDYLEFRSNIYFAFNKKHDHEVTSSFDIVTDPGQEVLLVANKVVETGVPGFDVEVGGALPQHKQLMGHVAYYYYGFRSDARHRNGIRGRARYQLTDIVSAELESSYDRERKFNFFAGFRFAFHFQTPASRMTLMPLQKKMTALPIRDIDILSSSWFSRAKVISRKTLQAKEHVVFFVGEGVQVNVKTHLASVLSTNMQTSSQEDNLSKVHMMAENIQVCTFDLDGKTITDIITSPVLVEGGLLALTERVQQIFSESEVQAQFDALIDAYFFSPQVQPASEPRAQTALKTKKRNPVTRAFHGVANQLSNLRGAGKSKTTGASSTVASGKSKKSLKKRISEAFKPKKRSEAKAAKKAQQKVESQTSAATSTKAQSSTSQKAAQSSETLPKSKSSEGHKKGLSRFFSPSKSGKAEATDIDDEALDNEVASLTTAATTQSSTSQGATQTSEALPKSKSSDGFKKRLSRVFSPKKSGKAEASELADEALGSETETSQSQSSVSALDLQTSEALPKSKSSEKKRSKSFSRLFSPKKGRKAEATEVSDEALDNEVASLTTATSSQSSVPGLDLQSSTALPKSKSSEGFKKRLSRVFSPKKSGKAEATETGDESVGSPAVSPQLLGFTSDDDFSSL